VSLFKMQNSASLSAVSSELLVTGAWMQMGNVHVHTCVRACKQCLRKDEIRPSTYQAQYPPALIHRDT
jgi:hypothetical protein